MFVLSFLGLPIGIILSKFTKEELKPGKKYFMLLEKVVLLAIGVIIVFYMAGYFLFFLLGLLAGFIFRRVYFYFGLALPLTFGSLLVLLPSLVFIFGLPAGTLITYRLKKKVRKDAIVSAFLFACGGLISSFLGYTPILMVCAGALIINCLHTKKLWIFPIG